MRRAGHVAGQAVADPGRLLGQLAIGQRAALTGDGECVGGAQGVTVDGGGEVEIRLHFDVRQ